MGFLDRLFGTNSDAEYRETTNRVREASAARSEDEVAVERYRYLLRTAPPETIEKVHEEAFTKLNPEQRKMLFAQLSADAPRGEAPRGDDAHSLAVSATRSEMRQPGTMEKSLGNVSAVGAGPMGAAPAGAAPGFGSMFGSSLLGSIAGYVIASTLMSAFLPSFAGDPGAGDSSQAGSEVGDGDGSGEFASADGGFDNGGVDTAGFDGGGMGDAGFGDFGDFGF
jgi:hypothetical protein